MAEKTCSELKAKSDCQRWKPFSVEGFATRVTVFVETGMRLLRISENRVETNTSLQSIVSNVS